MNRTFTLRAHTRPAGHRRLRHVAWLLAREHNAELEHWKHEARRWRWRGNPYPTPAFTYNAMTVRQTARRARNPELAALPTCVTRGAPKKLDRSIRARRGRKAGPGKAGDIRFKAARRWSTIEIVGAHPRMVKRRGSRYLLTVPGLPRLWMRSHRELPDSPPKNILITMRGRRIEVNIAFDIGAAPATHEPRTAIGVDMGVTDSVALSDGTLFPRAEPRRADIEAKQRRLSACKKGSRERRKRARILANAHARRKVKDRNRRHRITTAIVRKADLIAVEGLNIGAMTASAAGTIESPGKNVAAKSGLNRGILEQGWGMMRTQLAYKAESAGKQVVAVDPAYTSQACSACGAVEKSARNGKVYSCASCGVVMDADTNAARNILSRALAGVEKAHLLADALPP